MQNIISTFLARILGAWIAGLAAFLYTKYGVTMDSEAQKAFTEHLVGIIIPTFMTVYALAHRFISKRLNPGDAASGHLAEREAVETERIKGVKGL